MSIECKFVRKQRPKKVSRLYRGQIRGFSLYHYTAVISKFFMFVLSFIISYSTNEILRNANEIHFIKTGLN